MFLFQILFLMIPMLGLVLVRHTIGKSSKLNYISGVMILFLSIGLAGYSLYRPGANFTPIAVPALLILPLLLPATYLYFTINKTVKPMIENLIFSGLYLSSYAVTIYWIFASRQMWQQ